MLLQGVALLSTAASAQDATTTATPGPGRPTTSTDQEDNTGSDFARPLNLFQMEYQHRVAPGSGPAKGTVQEVATDTANLRLDGRSDLASQWVLATRADLPWSTKNPIYTDGAMATRVSGVGDADAQAAIIDTLNERWKVGAGVRIVAPTGDDAVGSGKWQVLPIVGARYDWPELSPGSYFEPLLRYDASFSGNPQKRDISNLQFAPTLNIALPNRWFLTLYPSPDIRINFGDRVTGQTGRLFVPLDLRITRKFTNSLAASLEVGVPLIRQYPVYDFKTQVRVNVSF